MNERKKNHWATSHQLLWSRVSTAVSRTSEDHFCHSQTSSDIIYKIAQQFINSSNIKVFSMANLMTELILKHGNTPLPDLVFHHLTKNYLSKKDCLALAFSGATRRYAELFGSNRYEILIQHFPLLQVNGTCLHSAGSWLSAGSTTSLWMNGIGLSATSLLWLSLPLMQATATGSPEIPSVRQLFGWAIWKSSLFMIPKSTSVTCSKSFKPVRRFGNSAAV